MGDCSKDLHEDRPCAGYESYESGQFRELRKQLADLGEEIERLKTYVEGRAVAQEEAHRRMMQALNEVLSLEGEAKG